MRKELIDVHGTLWGADSDQLRASLGTHLRGQPLTDYLIRNLGWLSLVQTGSRILVSCRPALLSDASIAQLFQSLFQHQKPVVAISTLSASWNHTIFSDPNKFVRFLSAMVDGERKARNDAAFRLLRQSKFASSSKLWRGANLAQTVGQGGEKIFDAEPMFDQLFAGRWSLFVINDTDHPDTTVVAHGKGYTPFNPHWAANNAGQSLSNYGDPSYGRWVTAHQCEASASHKITFDDLDVLVDFDSIGSTRLRYSRALVPIRRPCGRRMVLSAAVTDGSINLRRRFQEAG
jgi:hypothetical protein